MVFPIKGKNWCLSRSIDQSVSESTAANTPSTVKELWKKMSSNSKPLNANAELLVDFISNKVCTPFCFILLSFYVIMLNTLPFIFAFHAFINFNVYLKCCFYFYFCSVYGFCYRWIRLGWVWKRRLRAVSKTSYMGITSKSKYVWYKLLDCWR